ncbi:MAG: hypothetical protein M1839_003284 [Geoglossum umbratile]|nr:MAG: hypothetical protein M1839_003284 [Geoglossum umbratile]
MKRTIVLCFIHGFKGDTKTFYDFPEASHLKALVSEKLPEVRIELAVYPKYETTGNLASCTAKFREWLEKRVMELRKETLENSWPPTDRSVGVILVAHSMGGFVAADTLLSILNDQPTTEESAGEESRPIFPLIQGVLSFDTPYNGLARSMFVYGAFARYQDVSNIWSIMSTVSAGIASGSSAVIASRNSTKLAKPAEPGPSKSAWKMWQAIAVRSGAAGSIAAGGVAAYINRDKITKGIASFDKDTLGQGLAHISHERIGQGFAWISSHVKFMGALMKQEEMKQRLLRLGAIEGIGIANMYASLGENGTWTGGYFVPERTFCAIPSAGEKAGKFFLRHVNTVSDNEINAHISMFRPEKNDGYAELLEDASGKVVSWVQDDSPVLDLARHTPQQREQKQSHAGSDDIETVSEIGDTIITSDDDLNPLDVAAVAAAVPLPEDDAAED